MIRFGVIGAGGIARVFCEAVNGIEGASLVAIASRNLLKAQTYQSRYQFSKAYDSYHKLFEDDDVDCVYIATPHAFHYEQMMQALEHNKHILCEKPFTLNAAQAQKVFTKAKAKNLFVMEAMWMRFLPTIRAVVKSVSENDIGEIKTLFIDFCFPAEKDDYNRLFNLELGGGALLDAGIYPITLTNMLLGKPQRVSSDVTKYTTGVDIKETITYHYKDATAHMRVSFDDETKIAAEIQGTQGNIVIPYFNGAEKAFVYNNQGECINKIDYPHRINGFEYEILETIQCIKNNALESTIMPHRITLEILKQMDSLRKEWALQYPQT